jgi:hypothetical protein
MPTPASSRRNDPARLTSSLDGAWSFRFEGPAAKLTGSSHTINVPGIWQAHFEELRNSAGTGTYGREVEVPADFAGKRVFLVFEGIFHESRIRVGGKEAARHDNAWTPIEVEVTDAGPRFALEVEATVPDDRNYAERGLGVMLHGKQDWYGLQGGIWKRVRLEARDAQHLTDVAVSTSTDLKTHVVTVSGKLSSGEKGTVSLRVERDGKVLAEGTHPVGAEFTVELQVPGVALWSPDSPELYDFTATLGGDALTRSIGFRRFESRDGKLWLNGAPFFLIGALDQDWYPEEECRAPDAAFLEQRFRNAKAIGLNSLRCHVKIPDPLYFELADRLGIIIWQDMPYMEFLAPETRTQLIETFESTVAVHGHHPSICIWTIINEGWGIDLDDNPDDRRWLAETFDRLKPLVTNSLLVDNSPCFPRNYHVKTEIDDFHWYNAFPSQNDQFQKTTDEFAARPAWSYSPHGDAQRSGSEPLVCSEFGVWGLPHPRDIREADGREPWWFESGHDWNNGAGYPHGIEVRFRDAGLATVFGDLDRFVDAAQEAQYRGLKHQIETLRYPAPICGYVITELNDTQWEANGLMDARNNVRAFGERLAALQQPWLVVGRPARTSLRPDETVSIPVRLTGAAPSPAGTTLAWSFAGASGSVPLAPMEAGSAEVSIGTTAGKVSSFAIEALRLEARAADGAVLSTNSFEFCIVPPLKDPPALEAADPLAAAVLGKLGWTNVSTGPSAVLFATRLTGKVREALIVGRKVLLIANDLEALNDPERQPLRDLVNFPKMEIRQREGTFWDGRWMGAFTWRRTDGPWAGLPNGPMLDEHWSGLLPQYVLTGFRSSAFAGLVDAGVAVAWLHKAAAFSKRSFLGKGWLTVATFDLTSEAAQSNPLAPHVLAALARS